VQTVDTRTTPSSRKEEYSVASENSLNESSENLKIGRPLTAKGTKTRLSKQKPDHGRLKSREPRQKGEREVLLNSIGKKKGGRWGNQQK